jgi:dTDP-4-dehydrorhamnose reductase
MKILLIGASSYVGARLFWDISKIHDITGTYYGNKLSEKFIPLDVTDPTAIKNVIAKQKPQIIIHAASNANARWCETNAELAVKLNQESTKYIVEAANAVNAKVILISSLVAKKPVNVYGKTKNKSEEYAVGTKNGFVILRPSLIIGFSPNTINDRPFNRILKNIDEKTEAIYDTSWKFQPTYLRHISEVILEVIKKNIVNEIISIAVPEVKTRFDIAKDILGKFGITVTPVDKQDTSEVVIDDLKKLDELNLPKYSYHEIIEQIISEIKNREIYTKI